MDPRGNGNGNRENGNGNRDHDPELERYREAAWEALDQLEWCIDYLYRVQKGASPGRSPGTGRRSSSASAKAAISGGRP